MRKKEEEDRTFSEFLSKKLAEDTLSSRGGGLFTRNIFYKSTHHRSRLPTASVTLSCSFAFFLLFSVKSLFLHQGRCRNVILSSTLGVSVESACASKRNRRNALRCYLWLSADKNAHDKRVEMEIKRWLMDRGKTLLHTTTWHSHLATRDVGISENVLVCNAWLADFPRCLSITPNRDLENVRLREKGPISKWLPWRRFSWARKMANGKTKPHLTSQ